MARALTPSLEVRSSITLEKLRELPIPGEVYVEAGQLVKAQDVVAATVLPGLMQIEKLSEKLGFEPEEILAGLTVKEGDAVKEGDLLFEHKGFFGLFNTQAHSKVSGIVELITSNGHVSIRLPGKKVELKAYISGEVVSVKPSHSVLIKAQVALVQGIFGIGCERNGIISVVESEEELKQKISSQVDLTEEILVIKSELSTEMLQSLANKKISGIVCGSLDDQTLQNFLGYELGVALTGDEQIPFSLVITEGFGKIDMSDKVFNLLKKHVGKKASINGTTQVRAGAQRPEVIVALDAVEIKDLDTSSSAIKLNAYSLEIGAKVRVIRYPFFGKTGIVTDLPHAAKRVASGAEVRVLSLTTNDGTIIEVPRANVEIMSEEI